MPEQGFGKVLAIALRCVHLGPMMQADTLTVYANDAPQGDHGAQVKRGVTFLADGQWRQVNAELGADLPWHTRRANVLVDTDSLVPLIGRTIRVGQVAVHIHAETKPCSEMDYWHPGLREALSPDCRGGVYGQVVRGGSLTIGDLIVVTDAKL